MYLKYLFFFLRIPIVLLFLKEIATIENMIWVVFMSILCGFLTSYPEV
jgi:hypothetical protein